MATAAMPQQDIAAIQTLSLDGLTLSMFAKAAQFERLSADQSYSAALLRHAADSLKRLERERASLAADMEAACLARDTTGIEKADEKHEEDIARGRRLRLSRGATQETADD